MVYTDPDGEWIHLLIGGLVGGILNWTTHGAEFSLKSLGYFGVGALAGVLGAGIGAGVGAALAGNAAAGGGFAAGFMGTATISSTGFVAGSLSGAAAGITNGLITGTGNGLVERKNIGEALLSKNGGIDQAWKQGLGGAAFGGIMGGIDAIKDNRNFWTGSRKQYVVGNEKHLIAEADYKRSSTSVKNDNDVYIPEKKEPFSMEIEVKGMKEITNVKQRFPSDNPVFVNVTMDKNIVTLDFPIGTKTKGYMSLGGWRWQCNSRGSILPSTLIYSKVTKYSPLFFYLKYIIK